MSLDAKLQDLKVQNKRLLIRSVFRHKCKREPNDAEYKYWADYLINGGDIKEFVSRAPLNDIPEFNKNEETIKLEILGSEKKSSQKSNLTLADYLGSIEIISEPTDFFCSEKVTLKVLVKNMSSNEWRSDNELPHNISYHWLDSSGEAVVFDGLRTPFKSPLKPKSMTELEIFVLCPNEPGKYYLEITGVQDHVSWMELAGFTPKVHEVELKTLVPSFVELVANKQLLSEEIIIKNLIEEKFINKELTQNERSLIEKIGHTLLKA